MRKAAVFLAILGVTFAAVAQRQRSPRAMIEAHRALPDASGTEVMSRTELFPLRRPDRSGGTSIGRWRCQAIQLVPRDPIMSIQCMAGTDLISIGIDCADPAASSTSFNLDPDTAGSGPIVFYEISLSCR